MIGRNRSDTKELTTLVNAAAILYIHVSPSLYACDLKLLIDTLNQWQLRARCHGAQSPRTRPRLPWSDRGRGWQRCLLGLGDEACCYEDMIIVSDFLWAEICRYLETMIESCWFFNLRWWAHYFSYVMIIGFWTPEPIKTYPSKP